MYEAELQNYSFPNNSYAVFGYDSAWVLASALEKTVMQLKEKNMSLDNFSYKSASIRKESVSYTHLTLPTIYSV